MVKTKTLGELLDSADIADLNRALAERIEAVHPGTSLVKLQTPLEEIPVSYSNLREEALERSYESLAFIVESSNSIGEAAFGKIREGVREAVDVGKRYNVKYFAGINFSDNALYCGWRHRSRAGAVLKTTDAFQGGSHGNMINIKKIRDLIKNKKNNLAAIFVVSSGIYNVGDLSTVSNEIVKSGGRSSVLVIAREEDFDPKTRTYKLRPEMCLNKFADVYVTDGQGPITALMIEYALQAVKGGKRLANNWRA